MIIKIMELNKCNFIKKNDKFLIQLNPDFYPLEVIYSVSYIFLDKAYIWLTKDIMNNIIVNIIPKNGVLNEILPLEFNNELLTHLEYKSTFQENKSIRNMILQRAIITNDLSLENNDEDPINDYLNDDEDSIEDLEKVVIPWEEENEKNN